MNMPGSAFIAPRDVAARMPAGGSIETVMRELLPWASSFAVVPVSGFAVGAVVFGASGALYAGANLEFADAPLSASVHAEQAAVANAWLHGEREISALAATATPCGHCRQFLNELSTADRLAIFSAGHAPATLAELLPASFGPRDLGVRAGLLETAAHRLTARVHPHDALAQAALGAANAAYAPYTLAYAGVALADAAGTIVTGRYAECAAYNPSLPALQCALSSLALGGVDAGSIAAAVMVEAVGATSQRTAAEALLEATAGIRLRYVQATRPQ
jgi:cytidine deaminase